MGFRGLKIGRIWWRGIRLWPASIAAVLYILLKVFNIIVDADAAIGDHFLKVPGIESGNFAGATEAKAFLLKEGVQLCCPNGNRNFPQPVALVEGVGLGEAVGEVEGNLHDLGS